jgi:hypothetical protein
MRRNPAQMNCEDQNSPETMETHEFSIVSVSATGRIRTCDRRIRNPLLYPTELRLRPLHILPLGMDLTKLTRLTDLIPDRIWRHNLTFDPLACLHSI